MGLLDIFNTGDPQKDAAISRGLLSAGLQLMQSRGKLLPNLGMGGMAGIGGFDQERQRQLQAKRIGLQDELLQSQIDQQKREAELAKLPGQFYRAPSSPGVDATGGMDTALENPANASGPGGFDLPGYATALMGKSPLQAIQLQQLLKKDTTPLKVGKGEVLLDPTTRQPIYSNTQPDEDKESPVARLIRERNKLDPADPTRRIFDEAIKKASTHQEPVSINNYGSPLPVQLPGGGTGYIQPPSRPGGPSQILNIPGTSTPAVKPAEGTAKAPTEFEAKAGLYFKSMTKATETLDQIESTNAWRPSLAESATSNYPTAQTIAQTEARQKYTQAQRQWIDSINRVRSGANLPELEYHRAVRTFFPTYGEGENIRKQKADARRQEEEAMKVAAGKALSQEAAPSGLPSMSEIDAEIARRARRGK
jgi:hypothetical protein